jgi:hypothetical protein
LTSRFPDAYPPRQMSSATRALTSRGRRVFALLAAAACLSAGTAAAQAFVVGAGGSLLGDQGPDVVDNGFNRWGGYVFGELALGGPNSRQDGFLQFRFAYTSLPGAAADAPDIDAWSGLAIVCYRFRENWWEGGLFAGVGLYRILPKSLEPGQVAVDPTQTVVGFAAGAQSLFWVSRQFDVRLEVAGNFPNTEYRHTLVVLTAGVGYHF